jgi:uncharacterized membrane protein
MKDPVALIGHLVVLLVAVLIIGTTLGLWGMRGGVPYLP